MHCYKIKNSDTLCLFRSVVVGLTYLKEPHKFFERVLTDSENKNIRIGRKIQGDFASKLVVDVGLEDFNNEHGYTFDHVPLIEDFLDVQFKIIDSERMNYISYDGREREKKVYLYKSGDHFHTVTSMAAFFSSSYFCNTCNKAYKNKNQHSCIPINDICPLCHKLKHSDESKNKIYCEECR